MEPTSDEGMNAFLEQELHAGKYERVRGVDICRRVCAFTKSYVVWGRNQTANKLHVDTSVELLMILLAHFSCLTLVGQIDGM